MNDLRPLLEREQTSAGAFRSWVCLPQCKVADENAFATALVLRELSALVEPGALRPVRERAVAFLLRCESRRRPGLFAFWPEDGYPRWMGKTRLYEDADDTAIISVQLVEEGAREASSLLSAAERLLRYRADAQEVLKAPWQRRGAFLTWLYDSAKDNTIDCCVNANVVALLARAGLKDSEAYKEACSMIEDAVAMACDSPEDLARIVPYYPHPVELLYAVTHAVRAGADELLGTADRLGRVSALAQLRRELPDDAPVCSSADGRVVWISPLLQAVRRVRRDSMPGAIPASSCEGMSQLCST